MRIVAFDPGKNVGFALLDGTGALLEHGVVDLERARSMPLDADVFLVGDGTGSAAVIAVLVGRGVEPIRVDEVGTTLEGRHLYFQDHPPTGLMRLVPIGMRSPPRPIDDYAAYAIGLRWLAQHEGPDAGEHTIGGEWR
jgi:hypothetical protein